MIRKLNNTDLDEVIKIWLNENIKTHFFISPEYWKSNETTVKNLLPLAEVYIYEENKKIIGFIGLDNDYIAGIFIKSDEQSKGIGKKLLNFVKTFKTELNLNVYIKNIKAVNFYKRENFKIKKETVDPNTGEKEFFMIWKKE